MAFTFKGVTPKSITYKGSSVKTLTYKGVTIWKATTPFSFTYTGTYETEGDLEGNFIVRFKTSGTLTIIDHGTNNPNGKYDIFLVGGGATNEYNGWRGEGYGIGGGGGGYTATYKNLSLSGSHTIIIGEGGTAGTYSVSELSGKPSKFDSYSVDGGVGVYTGNYSYKGGDGGSGGACGSYYDGFNGGSDGSDGGYSSSTAFFPGKGQGTTTREFGESTGKLYAGGGGSGKGEDGTTGGYGGAGGGGNGYMGTNSSGQSINATSGEPNTGGGGGGGCNGSCWPGNGGSGIVCLRNAR